MGIPNSGLPNGFISFTFLIDGSRCKGLPVKDNLTFCRRIFWRHKDNEFRNIIPNIELYLIKTKFNSKSSFILELLTKSPEFKI